MLTSENCEGYVLIHKKKPFLALVSGVGFGFWPNYIYIYIDAFNYGMGEHPAMTLFCSVDGIHHGFISRSSGFAET